MGDEMLPSDEGMIKIKHYNDPYSTTSISVAQKDGHERGPSFFLVFLCIVWVGNLMTPDKRTGNPLVISTIDATFS